MFVFPKASTGSFDLIECVRVTNVSLFVFSLFDAVLHCNPLSAIAKIELKQWDY